MAALAVSLAIHAIVLALPSRHPQPSDAAPGEARNKQIDVTLARPTRQPPPVAHAETKPPAEKPPLVRPTTPKSQILTVPKPPDSPETVLRPRETQAEIQARREAVERFFEEIKPVQPPNPPTGDLAQRSLAMARGLARDGLEGQEPAEDSPSRKSQTAKAPSEVNPLSLELYFEAFVQKLNRSAAFVPLDRRERGARVAVVRVQIGADGTLKNYRIINAGDQQIEIEYVRRVVERAAPFAAFPADVRRANESLSFDICILPPRAGGFGGFSRSFGGHSCGDLG